MTDNNELIESLEMHREKLFRIAKRRFGDIDLANDAVQDTFLRLLQRKSQRITGNVEALCCWMLGKVCIDIQVKEARYRETGDTQEIQADEQSNETEVTHNEMRELYLVQTLSPELAQIVVMVDEGYTYAQIGAVQDVAASTALRRHRKAIRSLSATDVPLGFRSKEELFSACSAVTTYHKPGAARAGSWGTD